MSQPSRHRQYTYLPRASRHGVECGTMHADAIRSRATDLRLTSHACRRRRVVKLSYEIRGLGHGGVLTVSTCMFLQADHSNPFQQIRDLICYFLLVTFGTVYRHLCIICLKFLCSIWLRTRRPSRTDGQTAGCAYSAGIAPTPRRGRPRVGGVVRRTRFGPELLIRHKTGRPQVPVMPPP